MGWDVGLVGWYLFVHRPLNILSLSLSCYRMLSEHRRVYLDNEAVIFYKIIGHITVTPIPSNKWLLMFDGEFLSLICQHPGNFVPMNHPRPLEEVPDELCHSLSVDLSNTAWTQRGLINKLPGITFGAVTRIRPIIIITLGTTNIIAHNGITFGAGIGVGSCDRHIVTIVPCQDIVTFRTVTKL